MNQFASNMQQNQNQNQNPMQINVQTAMNQMNEYMMNTSQNTLYNQNIQSTWQNMQQNQQNPNPNIIKPIEVNLNNMTNILALINLPVVIPVHNQHPLINCKTPGRREIGSSWKCNNCWSIYCSSNGIVYFWRWKKNCKDYRVTRTFYGYNLCSCYHIGYDIKRYILANCI